jgi:hypothetical protein
MRAARIVDNKVFEIAELPEGFTVEECYPKEAGFIEAPDHAVVGGTYVGGHFGPRPERPAPKWNMEALRVARNQRLAATDWTQLPDIPEETRNKYKPYRQMLRDLPSKNPDLTNFIFPEPLGEHHES